MTPTLYLWETLPVTEHKRAKLLACLARAKREGDDVTVSICERKLKEAGVKL